MRVLGLSEYYPPENPGGAGKLACTLFSELAARGHEVEVFCPAAQRARLDVQNGVRIHRLTSMITTSTSDAAVSEASADFARMIESRVKLNEFDLIHDLGGFLFSDVTSYLTLRYRLPLVTHFLLLMGPYTAAEAMPSNVVSALARRQHSSAKLSDAIILTSTADRRLADLWLPGVATQHVEMIPNCIKPQDLTKPGARARARQRFGLEDRVGILTGGRLSSYAKGFDITIDAIAPLLHGSRSFCLLVTGELGDRRKLLEQLPPDSYRLLGWISENDLCDVQLASDYVIQTPRYEAFGLFVLESMAAGCIPLILNVGGLVDIVEDFQSGVIAGAYEIERIAYSVEEIEKKSELKTFLRRNAKARAGNFNVSDTAQQIEKVYSRISGIVE